MNETEWRNLALTVVDDMLDLPWLFGDWCLAADTLGLVDDRTDILTSDPRFEGTLLAEYAYVAERLTEPRRRPLPWSYHAAVARLPHEYQDALLDLAMGEEWTLQEMRRAAREAIRDLESGT